MLELKPVVLYANRSVTGRGRLGIRQMRDTPIRQGVGTGIESRPN
jgi:hypothetical protein